MKKRFGKLMVLAALGISAVMLATACGGNKETGSIRVFFGDGAGTDNAEVSDAVSKMAQEKIGVEVELVFFNAGEYDKKMPKLMATNEQMDIGWDAGDKFVSQARDGAYYNIKDDLKNYPGLTKLFKDEFLGGVTIDGGIYGIPTLKEMANNWALYIDKGTLDSLNLEASDIDTMADMEPILASLKSQGRNVLGIGNDGTHVAFDMYEHFDAVTGPFVISNDPDEKANSKKIVNYYETEEFANYVKLLNDWFAKGYIPEDIVENSYNTFLDIQTKDKSKEGIFYVCYSPLNEVGRTLLGDTAVPIQITPAVMDNNATRGSVMAIFKKSENVQSSLKFLELLNTDKDFNRLVKYGIEGKHYTMEEDEDGVKKIKRAEGWNGMYMNQNWRSGNMLLGNIEMGEPENKVEIFNEWNDSAARSIVLGFTPDVSTLEAELSACSAVVKGKCAALLTGAIDPEDPEYGLEAIKKEMQKAGSAKVVTELQKQYLTWLKEK